MYLVHVKILEESGDLLYCTLYRDVAHGYTAHG